MVEIKNKIECCGCESCSTICPKHCIKMVPDFEGFLYPVVNKDDCVDCGLCDMVCPIKRQSNRYDIKKSYVMQHNDKELRLTSSSGGAFSAIAYNVLKDQGVVYGVVFNKNMEVIHSRTTSEIELVNMRGSKYVQSKIGDVYLQVKKDLLNDLKVLFTGTPCQIEGLLNYLEKDYDNLITIGLVCHGVSSPKVWKKYISDLEEKFNSKVIKYSFRSKKTGFHDFGTEIIFSDGQSRYTHDKGDEKDFMHLAYFQEICSRPSCHDCKFKTSERRSDFTLFDCWHVSEFDSSMEDDLGTSAVFLHTDKAIKLFGKITNEMLIKEVDYHRLIELDGNNIEYSMKPNVNRKKFFNELDYLSIDELQNKYLKEKIISPIISFIKTILRRIGVFETVKRTVYKISKGSYKGRL